MTVDDLAEMLHKPKTDIYKYRAMGTAPEAMRVGKTLLFWRCNVLRWLREHETEPLSQHSRGQIVHPYIRFTPKTVEIASLKTNAMSDEG